mgnify:CR=1 FL=1
MKNSVKVDKQYLLLKVLKTPAIILELTPSSWDLLVRQARVANLLGHLYWLLIDSGLERDIPRQPKFHLESSASIAKRHAEAVRWEVEVLQEALFDLGVPMVVLKGAAYIMAELPISRGRLFNDIDIMVPKSAISEVETRLVKWGWRTAHNSAYDQKYYRTWMHEIPPLKHSTRQTVLDIHHSILPLTGKLVVDAGKLLTESVQSKSATEIFWFQSVDMVLHSAAHLFHDGELENGLRDLVDIDTLLKHFLSIDPNFYSNLYMRSNEMGLSEPLYYALYYCNALLSSEVDQDVLEQLRKDNNFSKRVLIRDWLFLRALSPMHSSCSRLGDNVARFLLYLRSHYLRMPLRLLIPHLIHKAVLDKDKPFSKDLQRFIDNTE